MKITSFRARKIYGYLRFDLSFFDDITFLHGINGSGKTTALKALISLVTPDIVWLATTSFDELSVALEVDGKQVTITAVRNSGQLLISFQEGLLNNTATLSLSEFTQLSFDDADYRTGERDLLKEKIIARIEGADTIKLIEQLPTPTFLGLERTTLPYLDDRHARLRNERRAPRLYFRTSMDESVREADRHLQIAIRQVLAEKTRASETLRTEITLSLFDINNEFQIGGFPGKTTLQQIRTFRDKLGPYFSVHRAN